MHVAYVIVFNLQLCLFVGYLVVSLNINECFLIIPPFLGNYNLKQKT